VRRYADEHLRRFLAARDRGDKAQMRRWWNELVIDFYDRMDGFVAAAHRGRLDDEEHELAVLLSMTRFSTRLIDSFQGVSMGQLVNACKTLARGICIDVQRRAARISRHETLSIDAGWQADDEDMPASSWEVEAAWARLDREQRSADVVEFLEWALPRIPESRRRVLELSFQGAELPEITQELDISRDNAYQRRHRGMEDLARLKQEYDS